MGRSPLVSCVLPPDDKSSNLESGMSDQSDDAVTDAAGGPAPAPDSRTGGAQDPGGPRRSKPVGPVCQAGRLCAQPGQVPSASGLYRWLNHRLGLAATSLGLSPRDVITLEVAGRRSGVIRRTVMVRAVCDGEHYVVALAGESASCGVPARGYREPCGSHQRPCPHRSADRAGFRHGGRLA
jgi:hypothetical protein